MTSPSRRARLRRAWVALAGFAVCLSFAPASAAFASWSATGAGSGAGAATVMPIGAAPAGLVGGTSVTVSWVASTLPGGSPVAGYVVNRINAVTGVPATVGSGCSGVVAATTCTEASVPAGTWVYTETPEQLSWRGGTSPDSPSIVVP
ncbi:MAG TPA: hypothetical protein VIY26_18340 [Acidimicrobiales bacterium]